MSDRLQKNLKGPRLAWIGGAAILGGAVLWWGLSENTGAKADERPLAAAGAPAAASGSAGAQAPLTAASAAQLAALNAAVAASAAPAKATKALISMEALRKTGSLRGTQLDGDWGQFSGGVLKPGFRLRQRLDHLMIGIGEVDPAHLRAWIAEQVKTAHGDKGAEQVLAVFDAYEKLLRSQVGGKAADPADAAAWQRWIVQLSEKRAAALGPAWADAFYGEEHQQLKDFGERTVQRVAAGSGAIEPEAAAQRVLLPSASVLDPKASAERQALRVQHFGEEGAQRLAAEDKAWAEWNQRIAAARARRQQITADKQLSDPQRQQAQEADLASRFHGTDLIRAKGLVGG